MKALPNVKTVDSEAEALPALQELGVRPRVEYAEANTVLLPVLRRTEEADYLYLYHYMYEEKESFETVVSVSGSYEPYLLDTWSGQVSEVLNYAVKDGRTEIKVNITPGETQLLVLRRKDAPEEGYERRTAILETAIPLSGWSLSVDSFEPGEKLVRTENNPETGVETTEVAYTTNHVMMDAGELKALFPWKYLPAVGKEVSGIGSYSISFTLSADDLADASRVLFRAESFEGGTASAVCNGQAVPVNMDSRTADLTGVVQPGENTLTVRVTSSLRNRMIAVGYDQGWNILKPEAAAYGMTGETELVVVRCYSGNE